MRRGRRVARKSWVGMGLLQLCFWGFEEAVLFSDRKSPLPSASHIESLEISRFGWSIVRMRNWSRGWLDSGEQLCRFYISTDLLLVVEECWSSITSKLYLASFTLKYSKFCFHAIDSYFITLHACVCGWPCFGYNANQFVPEGFHRVTSRGLMFYGYLESR